jgi:hypothetical protein
VERSEGHFRVRMAGSDDSESHFWIGEVLLFDGWRGNVILSSSSWWGTRDGEHVLDANNHKTPTSQVRWEKHVKVPQVMRMVSGQVVADSSNFATVLTTDWMLAAGGSALTLLQEIRRLAGAGSLTSAVRRGVPGMKPNPLSLRELGVAFFLGLATASSIAWATTCMSGSEVEGGLFRLTKVPEEALETRMEEQWWPYQLFGDLPVADTHGDAILWDSPDREGSPLLVLEAR